VLAADHLVDGRAAIEAAMASDVLRPHWAAVEARRLARRSGDRPADLRAVGALLDEAAVLTPSEIRRLSLLAASAPADQPEGAAAVLALMKTRAARAPVGRGMIRFPEGR
jgi:cytochrome c-type biogenesis protein CcmH/NrfG